jgi:hypothetical protein
VLKLRSVNNIVIAPAKTGRERIKRIAVIATAHRKRGNELILYLYEERAEMIVVRKLMEPKIELTPAKWRLRIAISTDTPE